HPDRRPRSIRDSRRVRREQDSRPCASPRRPDRFRQSGPVVAGGLSCESGGARNRKLENRKSKIENRKQKLRSAKWKPEARKSSGGRGMRRCSGQAADSGPRKRGGPG